MEASRPSLLGFENRRPLKRPFNNIFRFGFYFSSLSLDDRRDDETTILCILCYAYSHHQSVLILANQAWRPNRKQNQKQNIAQTDMNEEEKSVEIGEQLPQEQDDKSDLELQEQAARRI
jgi:hypothetical protein